MNYTENILQPLKDEPKNAIGELDNLFTESCNPDNILLEYRCRLFKDEEGCVNSLEAILTSPKYENDEDTQIICNQAISEMGLTNTMKRNFVTFGIKSALLEEDTTDKTQCLLNICKDVAGIIEDIKVAANEMLDKEED